MLLSLFYFNSKNRLKRSYRDDFFRLALFPIRRAPGESSYHYFRGQYEHMIAWKFSAFLETCALILLSGCGFFGKIFGRYVHLRCISITNNY